MSSAHSSCALPRQRTSQEPAADADVTCWTTVDNLLLAQSVYRHGASDWTAVCKTLRAHPLVAGRRGSVSGASAGAQQKEAFSQRSCEQQFQRLLDAHGLTFTPMEQRHGDTAQIPAPAQLARVLFGERMAEVRGELQATVHRIKTLVEECQAIEGVPGVASEEAPVELDDVLRSKANLDSTNGGDDDTNVDNTDDVLQVDKEHQHVENTTAIVVEPQHRDVKTSANDTDTVPELPLFPSSTRRHTSTTGAAPPPKRRASTSSATVQSAKRRASISTASSTAPRNTSTTSTSISLPLVPAATIVTTPLEQRDIRSWRKVMLLILDDIATHRHGPVFQNAPTSGHYRDVISQPMDLTTVRQRVRDGNITTTADIHRDLLLMTENALTFNRGNDTPMLQYATEMRAYINERIAAFLTTEQGGASGGGGGGRVGSRRNSHVL